MQSPCNNTILPGATALHCICNYFFSTESCFVLTAVVGLTRCLVVDARSPHHPCLHLFDPCGATLGGSAPGGAYIITWMGASMHCIL